MKKILSMLIILSMLLSLFACKAPDNQGGNGGEENGGNEGGGEEPEVSYSFINGVNLDQFKIVYSADDLDYAKRAAEYIKSEIKVRTNLDLPLVTDSEATSAHEIVVGNTARAISERLDAETEGLEFAILAEENAIALEGDYFVIAAAAYFFVETYVPSDDFSATIPTAATVHEPIVKEAKNFIMLIGDGMGVNQTLLFDYLDDVSGYSDGENQFYGYMLPYMGYSRTDSLSGTTDSAAGATALSTGYKTYNEHVGRDKDGNDITLMTELFGSLGKKTAVMSTENQTGATPSSFSAHAYDRNDSADILDSQVALKEKYGTVIDCGYDYYTARYIKVIENHITDTLSKVEGDEGFFLMYEEAHIDKHNHDNEMDKTFLALIRFNQAIGRFMEFAFYNPETFILITADHESGGLILGDDGMLKYTSEEHTSADVPVFAYGDGAELFGGKTVENIQIAHTIASFVGVTDHGDQSTYQYLK